MSTVQESSAVEVKAIRAWNLLADDMEATVAFYRDVLGAVEIRRYVLRGTPVVRLRLGNCVIGVFDGSSGPVPGVPHHSFDLSYRSSGERVAELEARGAKVSHVREHGEGQAYSAYVQDPNGNHIELSVSPD
jgi:predicted enzyme related to lactoylglutathione lyase